MSKHVLIAEDETFLADTMGKLLQKYSVRVTIAYDGKEAIKALENEVPDLLLLDILLPKLDGHGVLKFIQDKELEFPVIVLSNLSDRQTKEECKRMKVKHYIVKNDIDDDDLWPAIEQYLR
ncbi:MAG: response regulator [Candidatus Peribacteraceae bacterium]|nr:response regulator [Candidatus Peribacteraceae bacterium]